MARCLITAVLVLAACGHRLIPATGDDDGGRDGAVGDGDGHDGSGSDGGTHDDAGTHDSGTLDGGSSGGSCGAAHDPTLVTALSGAAAFPNTAYPRMAYAGGSVFAIGPFGGGTGWYRWAGGGWSFITPPWPAGPTPFIIDIFDLATGHVLFFVQITYAANNYDYALVDFDGTSMSAPVILPAAWRANVRKATRTPDGTYHLLTYAAPGDPVWSLRSGDAAGFGAASPVPISPQVVPEAIAFTSLTNGRMTLVYSTGHLYELHRTTGAWSTAVDLTPTWAVAATEPLAVGARSGGIALAVTGVSNSYQFPYYWDSVDGVTYSAGEYTSPSTQLGDHTKFLAADCIANPILVIRRAESVMLLERGPPGNWPPLTSGPSTYSAGGTAVALGDGRTFFGWSYVTEQGDPFTTLLASP